MKSPLRRLRLRSLELLLLPPRVLLLLLPPLHVHRLQPLRLLLHDLLLLRHLLAQLPLRHRSLRATRSQVRGPLLRLPLRSQPLRQLARFLLLLRRHEQTLLQVMPRRLVLTLHS